MAVQSAADDDVDALMLAVSGGALHDAVLVPENVDTDISVVLGFDSDSRDAKPAARIYYVGSRAPDAEQTSVTRKTEEWVLKNLSRQLNSDSLKKVRAMASSTPMDTSKYAKFGSSCFLNCAIKGSAGDISCTALLTPGGHVLGLVSDDDRDFVTKNVLLAKRGAGEGAGHRTPASRQRCIVFVNSMESAEFTPAAQLLGSELQMLNRWQAPGPKGKGTSLKLIWHPLRTAMVDPYPLAGSAASALTTLLGSPTPISVVKCAAPRPLSIALSAVTMVPGREGAAASLPEDCRCMKHFKATTRQDQGLLKERGRGGDHIKGCGAKRRRLSSGLTLSSEEVENKIREIEGANPACKITTPARKALTALLCPQ